MTALVISQPVTLAITEDGRVLGYVAMEPDEVLYLDAELAELWSRNGWGTTQRRAA